MFIMTRTFKIVIQITFLNLLLRFTEQIDKIVKDHLTLITNLKTNSILHLVDEVVRTIYNRGKRNVSL